MVAKRSAHFGAAALPPGRYDDDPVTIFDDLPDETVVQFPLNRAARPELIDGAEVTNVGDNIVVDFAPGQGGAFAEEMPPPEQVGFSEDLSRYVDEIELHRIAEEIIEWVQTDDQSRGPYFELRKKGFERLGVVQNPDSDELFPGCSQVTYPLIGEAVVQFNARALKEVFPSRGPVKVTPLGDKVTEELVAQAKRVAAHMNYQLTIEDKAYFRETDQLLWLLPQAGSVFRKSYHDDLTGMNCSRMVKSEDLIVPYTATSLETSPRFTHRLKIERNDMRKKQQAGFYRDVDLIEPTQEDQDLQNSLRDAQDEAELRTESYADDDYRHTVYECYCDYNVPGFEDVDPMTGEMTGIALPYVISVDYETRTVLSIRRNWKQNDPKRIKRVYFTHYYFFPGEGFYGYGYVHILGGLSDAATGAVRALLDAAAFANMQGGFKASDSKMKGGSVRLVPGVYHDIDLTAEELNKAFYTPPFKEPSPALFQLLGILIEAAKRFMSTTEAMVGDAANTGPVGTTVALIEQGSQVYATIHKRLHIAAGHEFRTQAELNAEYMTDAHSFLFGKGNFTVRPEDYDDFVDIAPVSDPNIFSATQRIAQNQGIVALDQQYKGVLDPQKVVGRMLDAMEVPDPDDLFANKKPPERLDPVSQVMALLAGKPVMAYPDQNHEAHVIVLANFMASPGFGGNPDVQKVVGPQLVALLGQHLAYLYQVRMGQAGLPPRPVNLAGGGDQPMAAPMAPPDEYRYAMMAAQVSPQVMQAPGLPVSNAETPEQQKMRFDEEAFKADEVRKQRAFESEQARLDERSSNEIRRQDEKHSAGLDNEAISAFTTRGEERRDREQARDLDAMDAANQLDQQMRADAVEEGGIPGPKEGNSREIALPPELIAQMQQQSAQTEQVAASITRLGESLVMMAAQMAEMAKVAAAEKRVIYGADGRPKSVAPILEPAGNT